MISYQHKIPSNDNKNSRPKEQQANQQQKYERERKN